MPPDKDVLIPILGPVTMLPYMVKHGKRNFAEVIKSRILRWGDSPGFWVGPI